ncbi:hypothetical protein CHLNCDRAFT_32297 [Chlorella variabilis]|uniref:Glycine cleavage system H protein n=1 Tax=Chlorella variabilis TaxID=554065 RepID=E1ZLH9_CHLVA|nr:hypothetical protein CHLNCDRAFT_32297 [Chlorella variabilis]EFN53270.1 hypothetical protein CHLNCDRAFT_32297 [Chlorella variabilis]|eukprot:XP_005845372.1 hypothetical protein CHLNCDRAFT_32297 [Chlorella variabilis]
MALAAFAKKAVGGLGLRCGAPLLADSSSTLRSLAVRGYATVLEGLKYSEDHEWVKLEGDTAVVGITDFAQEELGDLVYVELPEVGSTVTAGERFSVVESVKAASDVISPVTGEVTEVNSALSDDSSKVNTDPFGEGWMVKVKLADASQLDGLMDSNGYTDFCK